MLNKLSFIKNPCLSTSQDNCSEVDTQSTNETSVRVAITNNGNLTRQDTGVNPACRMSTSEDNNNGVGVKADTLCITGSNATEALWTTDQQSHPGNKEPWTCPVDRTKDQGCFSCPTSASTYLLHHTFMYIIYTCFANSPLVHTVTLTGVQ